MHHGGFWAVTLREYDLITRARIKAKNAEFEARRVLNQELGVLVSHAFHNPKKMPDFTKAGGAQQKARKTISGAKATALLRLHFNRMCQT